MQDKTIISIAAIVSILFLEGIALLSGINGIVLTASVSAITAIAGYNYGKGAIKTPEYKTTKQNKIKGEI